MRFGDLPLGTEGHRDVARSGEQAELIDEYA